MMNAGPGGLNLVIARGRLRDGENLDAFVAREWEVASRDARMLTEKTRRPVTVAGRAGVQIDSTHERDGRLWHQVQTMFPSDDAGRVLVMTLTSAAPLTDEQQAIADRMLASFQPRAARPTLLGPGDAS
ncbi:DcrB-related protein [Burkholderia cepacia]|nr:DcrB-related protein [Burkholderia cepacia]MDN7766899.1 DcrB-related protein [Burkholderia cepacia]